jgi:hypothetical protein
VFQDDLGRTARHGEPARRTAHLVERFILMLPMFEQGLPPDFGEVLGRALAGIGALDRVAVVAALVDG